MTLKSFTSTTPYEKLLRNRSELYSKFCAAAASGGVLMLTYVITYQVDMGLWEGSIRLLLGADLRQVRISNREDARARDKIYLMGHQHFLY